MATDFEIIVGTYEHFMLGYKIEKIDKSYKLERSFATRSHMASVRTVACKKHYLASGGADDSISLYDLRSRAESGKLTHHDGTVNCVTFTPDGTHILSCSADGSIGIVRCGNWQLEKHLKSAHKGSEVITMAVHPTGKLALSVGTDGVLRTWNLIKGRHTYATNLVPRLRNDAKNITVLHWSPNGEKYLMAANNKLDVYSIETAGIVTESTFDSKIVCIDFIDNDEILIGHEDGKIRIYNISEQTEILETVAHDTRIKCIQYRDKFIVSASSTGEIKLWKLIKGKLKLLSSITCDARITCMTFT